MTKTCYSFDETVFGKWEDTTKNPNNCNVCGKYLKVGAPARYLTTKDCLMMDKEHYVFCVKCHGRLMRLAEKREVTYPEWVREHSSGRGGKAS